jgi:hypothetical protein
MAKPKGGNANRGRKINFSKEVINGKAKKKFGPKENRPKKYRGQGRV